MKTPSVSEIISQNPTINFLAGSSFYWSPEKKLVTYSENSIDKPAGIWALLHEISHAKLNHINYSSDVGLLKLEVEAWDKAKSLAIDLNMTIDEDHVQDCLDTYRDWLYRRSTCPNCNIVCIQNSPTSYRCHNCSTIWSVSASRFCRPYRLTKQIKEKRPQTKSATFS